MRPSFGAQEFVIVRNVGESGWSGKAAASKRDATCGADPQSLTLSHYQASVGPTVVGIVGAHRNLDRKKCRSR